MLQLSLWGSNSATVMYCKETYDLLIYKLEEFKIDQKCFARYMLFFISNTFVRNTMRKLAKNQAKAQQHREGELFLSEYFSLCSHTADLVTFTEAILNEKLHFLCSVIHLIIQK